jgi:hypothetical protein
MLVERSLGPSLASVDPVVAGIEADEVDGELASDNQLLEKRITVRPRRVGCTHGYPLGNLESQCGAARWYEAVVETPVTGFRNETDAFLDTIEQHFEMALEFLATMATGLIARRAEMRKETEPAVVA